MKEARYIISQTQITRFSLKCLELISYLFYNDLTVHVMTFFSVMKTANSFQEIINCSYNKTYS